MSLRTASVAIDAVRKLTASYSYYPYLKSTQVGRSTSRKRGGTGRLIFTLAESGPPANGASDSRTGALNVTRPSQTFGKAGKVATTGSWSLAGSGSPGAASLLRCGMRATAPWRKAGLTRI